jgi:putative ABC transport system permease protein
MLLRPLGPIGLGRRLVDSAGMSLDPVVAVPAVVLLVALLLGAGAATTWMAAGPARTPARVNRRPLPVGASPTAATGLALGFSGWSRRWTVTTVLAVAATVAAAIGAVIVLASLRQLTSEPARFGATWDMSAAALLGPDSAETLVQALGELPGVEAAAGLLGNDARIGDDLLYTYAFAPLDGLPEGIGPVISRGRAPSTPGEVALGALSMERAGVDIGDSVPLSYLDHTADLEVVGEAVINDGHEDIPGTGAIVHHEWLQSVDPDNWATDVVVRFEPEAREVGVAAMEAAFPQTASSPLVHAGIRDLQRIDSWLVALSGFAAALAAATFAHALSVTVRRQQRQLGVLRALGFARRQVRASVAWLASLVAVVAVVIGVPVGAAIGRWGWGRFAHNLGIPSVPVVPLVTMALVALAALVVANVIAFPLAWRAARGRPADALRAE